MSMIAKLAGLAQKALDKSGSSNHNSAAGHGDWRSMVRGAADALTGDSRPAASARPVSPSAPVHQIPRPTAASPVDVTDADRSAIARYDYLLKTADPEQIEQVHREAFARLTPAQRDHLHERMTKELPAHERPRSSGADDLARTAARTEAGRPGFLRGLLARAGGTGAGSAGRGALLGGAAAGAGLAAGGVLAAVAGGAVVSSIAGPLLEQAANVGVDFNALASGLDVENLTGGFEGLAGGVEGVTGGVESLAGGAGDAVSGLGDQLSEFGSNFTLPGLKDLFGR